VIARAPAVVRFGAADGKFEGVVGGTGVAVWRRKRCGRGFLRALRRIRFRKPWVFVVQARRRSFDDLRRGEGIENVDLGAGEQRGDDFEGWILGGCADENDVAGFDVGEEGILLGFVEAVDFVDKDDGAMAGTRFVFRGGHDFL